MLLLKSYLNKPLPQGSLDLVCKELAEVRSWTKFLRLWNQILVYIIGIAILYGLWEAYQLSQPVTIPPLDIIQQDEIPFSLKDLEMVRQRPNLRNPFEPFSSQEEQARQISDVIQKFKAQYRVVGVVVLGEEPQVILEDLKTQETFYAKRKQRVGEAMLKEIKDQEIIWNISGQTFVMIL